MIKPIQPQMSGAGLQPQQPETAAARPKETGTALVLVTPVGAGEETALPTRRTSASYLAHLIATRNGAPQTRGRRRAEPQEAIAAYENVLERIHRFP